VLDFLQAASVVFKSPPRDVNPFGQRMHLQLLLLAPLMMRMGQLGGAAGRA
jgi:hypothetical protein